MSDPDRLEARLLALEHTAAVALCFATVSLSDGSLDGHRRATRDVEEMLVQLRRAVPDTRNNSEFNEALKAVLTRYLCLIGAGHYP